MRLTVIAATVCVAACSSAPVARPSTTERILMVTDEGVIRAHDGKTNDSEIVLKISPDSALMLLAAAYEDVGVEITMRDPKSHEIGNRNFAKYYRLGDSPISTYLGCGDTESGPAANKRRVSMSLISTVSQELGGVVIRTHLQGRAEQPEFSTWSSCLTTGALERRVNGLVEAKMVLLR